MPIARESTTETTSKIGGMSSPQRNTTPTKHRNTSKGISKEARLTIVDSWSTIKRHASGELKKRYRELMKELI